MENQALFSSKNKSKKLKCLLQFLFGTLWVNAYTHEKFRYLNKNYLNNERNEKK